MMSSKMIRLYRKALGLSSTEFSRMIGLTKQSLLNVENGTTTAKSTMILIELMFDKIKEDIGEDKFMDLIDTQQKIDLLEDKIKENKIDVTKYLREEP